MRSSSALDRRSFLAALAAAGLAAARAADKSRLPRVRKRIEKVFLAPGRMPNGLQCASDGLWILDQEDPNRVHKVRYEDGAVLHSIVTESQHGSGITQGDGALWIASTFGLKTLKVDPATGRTLAAFDTPGAGLPRSGQARRPSGAHGLEWVDGRYWIAVPPTVTIYLVEPATGQVVRSIPAPGARPHGIAWHAGRLWCVESNDRAIYELDPKDGTPLRLVQLEASDPEPHGMSMRSGEIWYCDAASRWVCRLRDA